MKATKKGKNKMFEWVLNDVHVYASTKVNCNQTDIQLGANVNIIKECVRGRESEEDSGVCVCVSV